jgi:AcrR family transcriptional regulator
MAARQVFEELGSIGATTRRIAGAAGVNEATLFRHFGTKDALLREAMEAAARQVPFPALPKEPQDPRAELTAWAGQHLEGMHRARAMIRTSLGEMEAHPGAASAACEVPVRIARELHRYLERLCDGDCAAGGDAAAATAVLMGAILSDAITRDLMPERYPLPPEEAAAQYVAILLRGIGVAEIAEPTLPPPEGTA